MYFLFFHVHEVQEQENQSVMMQKRGYLGEKGGAWEVGQRRCCELDLCGCLHKCIHSQNISQLFMEGESPLEQCSGAAV